MSWLDRFEAWAMHGEPVTGAVAYRLTLTAWTLLYFVPRIAHLEELYAREVLREPAFWLRALTTAPPPAEAVYGLVAILFFACLCFAAGKATRFAHIAIFLCLGLLFSLDTTMTRAYGTIALIHWGILWFVPYDQLRDDQGEIRREPQWSTRLLMFQFASIYPLSAFAKIVDSTQWIDGRAVYLTANSPDWGLTLLSSGGVSQEVAVVLGIGTLIIEVFIGFGLFHPRTRPLAMIAVIAFHGILALTTRISLLFGALMIAHLVLFLSPETWRSLGVQSRRIAATRSSTDPQTAMPSSPGSSSRQPAPSPPMASRTPGASDARNCRRVPISSSRRRDPTIDKQTTVAPVDLTTSVISPVGTSFPR